MKLYQITDEYLEEYIAIKKLELGYEVVEHLAILRDDVGCEITKALLQKKINEYAEEFKVCKCCFDRLEPIVAKERFDELDNAYYREYLMGYECGVCGKEYRY